MRRKLLIALAIAVAMPVLLFALLATEFGSGWLLRMASRAAGDGFSYSSVEGSLLSELRFSQLGIRAAGHDGKADQLIFRWRPWALLSGRLHFEQFSIRGVAYTAPAASEDTAEKKPAGGVSIPISVQVDDVSVMSAVVRSGEVENRIDRVVMQGFSVDGQIVTLALLEVAADALELRAHGQVDPSPPHAVEAGIAWSLRLPDGARAEGAGNLTGTLETIRIEHGLSRPFALDLTGTVSPLAEPMALDLSGQWTSIRWPLSGTPQFASNTGTFSARGSLAQMALNLDASLDSEAIPAKRFQLDAELQRPGDELKALLQWTAILADGQQVQGGGRVSGDASKLNIDHALEKPLHIATRGTVNLAGRTPEFSLDGEWRKLAWPLTGDAVVTSDAGRYRFSGVADAFDFELEAALRSGAAQIEQMDLTLAGKASATAPFPFEAQLNFTAMLPQDVQGAGGASLKGNAERIEIDTRIERPLALNARGNVALAGNSPELQLSGDWRDLRWPFDGEAEYKSESGSFTLAGPIEQLALEMNVKSSGRLLPPAASRVIARVQPKGANLRSLSIKTLGGEIRASGEVSWQPAPRWKMDISASGLNPGLHFGEWPGDIGFEAGVSGRVDAGAAKLDIQRLKVDGKLRGYPVTAGGDITIDGSRVSARSLKLRSGNNRVEINGDAGERFDLRFVVDAPALTAIAPKVQGRLAGEGSLKGSRDQPRLKAKFSGSDLNYAGNRVESLVLDLDAGSARGDRSRVDLNASGIQADGQIVRKISLAGDGTPEAHRLVLNVAAEAASITAEATGSYLENVWTGTIASSLESKDFGQWRTPRSATLSAGAEQVRLQAFCLEQIPARVCASANWRAESDAIEASGEITQLPLVLARPLLPDGLRIEGALDGKFDAGGTLSAPQARAEIVAASGAFIYEPGSGFEGARFSYSDGRLDARYAPAGAQLQLGLQLEDAGNLSARVKTGGFGNAGSPPLDGRIEAKFADLGWIGVMVPQLVDVRGRLDLDLDVGGTLESPALTGAAALKDAETKLPDLGLELRRINFSLRSDKADQVVLKGEVSSGDGRLEINGRSDLSLKQRKVNLELTGKEFEVVRLPTVRAFVSPELRLSADPELAELSGSVHIPRATVALKELPQTAVKVSDDEVIVNAEEKDPGQKPRRGPLMRVNVDLSLGDEVSFKGFGLSTRIDGKLALSGESGLAPQAQGTLSLREGRYEAYGQDLKIQSGRLLFAGPIDNPGIDVTAVRELKDVTAGIVVSGNVNSISSRVFSDPSLPEAEAFSYLLTGRPLSGGSESDAAKLQQAAAALGLNRAQMITQQIGNKLGLDELSVGGDGVDQTSLLLGKQITPDIFIRYALGVFEESGKLLLDYRLTDSVSVQAESGEQQGMDIIYKIEREKLF